MKLVKPPFEGIKPRPGSRPEGRFNPAEKVSIHNPLPQRLWPFKFGEKVYVALDDCVIGAIVDWYLPAREQDASSVVTPGRPLVWCVTDGPRTPFSPGQLFRANALGLKKAWFKVSANLQGCSAQLRAEAARQLARANDAEEQSAAIVECITRNPNGARVLRHSKGAWTFKTSLPRSRKRR